MKGDCHHLNIKLSILDIAENITLFIPISVNRQRWSYERGDKLVCCLIVHHLQVLRYDGHCITIFIIKTISKIIFHAITETKNRYHQKLIESTSIESKLAVMTIMGMLKIIISCMYHSYQHHCSKRYKKEVGSNDHPGAAHHVPLGVVQWGLSQIHI